MTKNKSYRLDDLKTPQQRIAAWCDWFNAPIHMATSPANTVDDLIAQIEWFREDLGGYIEEMDSKEHDKIFDTLLQGVANAKAQLGLQDS